MSQKTTYSIGALIALIIIIGLFFVLKGGESENKYFSLSDKDNVSEINWDLPTINSTDESKERAEKGIEIVEKTKNEIDTHEYHMTLATNYRLLKDGEKAYQEYLLAIETLPEKSLAYGNLGELLESAGAINSARTAFEKARDLEPQFSQNHSALIDFYIRNFSEEKEIISDTYKKAIEHLGQNEDILKSEASWLEMNGDIQGALSIWKKLLPVSENKAAIQAKIRALETKQ